MLTARRTRVLRNDPRRPTQETFEMSMSATVGRARRRSCCVSTVASGQLQVPVRYALRGDLLR